MTLMLKRYAASVTLALGLACLPIGVLADSNLASPNDSTSVLQPTPSDSLQSAANEDSTATANYLNGELVGGVKGQQSDNSAAVPSPWANIIAVAVMVVILGGLVVAYRHNRHGRQRAAVTTTVKTAAPAQAPRKAKPKHKGHAKGKAKSKAKKR